MFSVNLETKEMFIYDEIGPAWMGMIDAATVIAALDQMKGQRVKVRINTPGGNVDEGVAIYNAMKRHTGGVDTLADSLAASMGSYIMQAGERRIIARNARVMIHDPWTITWGNSAALRKAADLLDTYATSMVDDYAERGGKTVDEVRAIMAAETWYTAAEAVDAGWADEIGNDVSADPPKVPEGRFRNTPSGLLAPAKPGTRNSRRYQDVSIALTRAKLGV